MFLVILLLLLPRFLYAGDLEKFEADVNTQSVDRPHHSHSYDSDDWSCLTEILFAPFWDLLTVGASHSLARETGPSTTTDTGNTVKRQIGDRLLPRIRLDFAGQHIEDDISAVDIRGEGGYGPAGGQVRYTRMWDDGKGDQLSATYFHFLWRMALGSKGEIDFGLGGLNLAGLNSTTGGSATVPIQLHGNNFGVELRPAWSSLNGKLVEDYDLAAVAGMKFVALRAGYRWLLSEHESLHGPYVGMSLTW